MCMDVVCNTYVTYITSAVFVTIVMVVECIAKGCTAVAAVEFVCFFACVPPVECTYVVAGVDALTVVTNVADTVAVCAVIVHLGFIIATEVTF